MRAVGVSGYMIDGAETNALDMVEVDGDQVRWTIAPADGGEVAVIESDDAAVVAFMRRALAGRMASDRRPPTSA